MIKDWPAVFTWLKPRAFEYAKVFGRWDYCEDQEMKWNTTKPQRGVKTLTQSRSKSPQQSAAAPRTHAYTRRRTRLFVRCVDERFLEADAKFTMLKDSTGLNYKTLLSWCKGLNKSVRKLNNVINTLLYYKFKPKFKILLPVLRGFMFSKIKTEEK